MANASTGLTFRVGVSAIGLAACSGWLARRAARLAQRLAQQVLDLGVQAAQVVVGPALNALEDSRVDSQEKGFPLRHWEPTGEWFPC